MTLLCWSGPLELDLLDACLTLQPAYILHDLIDIAWGHALDLWHIAELPVVCLDAVGCSPLESLISVVVRLIDLMDERGAVVRSCCLFSMAGRTICIECRFTSLELGRYRPAGGYGFWRLRRIAGCKKTEHQEPCAELKL